MKNTISVINQFIGANNQCQFVIPTYQRNYVWDTKQVKQLLCDIYEQFKTLDDPKKMHYIGTIVTIETKKEGFFSEKTIIDGQQRLTTLFLILYAIKYACLESTDYLIKAKAEAITLSYLENKMFNTMDTEEKYKFRLKPLISDDDVFEKIAIGSIYDYKNQYTESKVYKSFVTIKKEIEKWLETYSVEQIINAMDKLRFMWLELDQESNPQQVFESINSTGVALSPADLIRNFLLMNKENDLQTKYYNLYWVPVESDYVGTENLAEFFRFYISIKEGITISKKDVYEDFKIYYKDAIKISTEEEILNNIKNFSKYYKYVIRKYDDDIEIENFLKDYRKVESNMPHMLLMYIFDEYKEDHISKEDLIKSIKLVTNYILRRNLCGEDTHSISKMFGLLVGRLSKREVNKNLYSELVKSLVYDNKQNQQYMPTDKNIYEEFKDSNMYSRGLLKFALEKIENKNNRIELPLATLSIEHVMPQHSTDYWEKYLSNKDMYDELVNHIGNLTLVSSSDNSSMKNYDFSTKKQFLSQTKHIKMNEDIISNDIWNEDKINERSYKMAEEFISIFSYPDLSNYKDEIKTINLLSDSVDAILTNVPLSLKINNIELEATTWTEVYRNVLKHIYNENIESFQIIMSKIQEDFNYSGKQFSANPEELRSPFEISKNVYGELNKSTKEKLQLIRRIYSLINNEDRILVLVENKLNNENNYIEE